MLRNIAFVIVALALSTTPSTAQEKGKMCPITIMTSCDQLKTMGIKEVEAEEASKKVKVEMVTKTVCLSDEDWKRCSGKWWASTHGGAKSPVFTDKCGTMTRPKGSPNYSWKNRDGKHYVFSYE